MTSILTATQAANALRVANNDPRMLDLLPQIDEFIKRASGRDWTQDDPINPAAIAAATMLLVKWFEDPGAMGSSESLTIGLSAALAQLEAEALKYHKYVFYGLHGSGLIALNGAHVGDQVIKLVGIYGATGDQSSKFADAIGINLALEQISSDDLSQNVYAAILKSPAEDVLP